MSEAAIALRAPWLGTSDMAQRARAFDWAATPLGPLEGWPASLRMAVGICLHSRFQMAIYWGPELTCLYNDAEREIMGALHPGAFGRPAREVLRDSWDVLEPKLRAVLETGEASWAVDEQLMFERRDRLEAGYFTYSYSPIPDEGGRIRGVLLVTEETTARVLAERRVALLRALAEHAGELETVGEACRAAIDVLDGSEDVPVACLYVSDDGGATARCVASSSGVTATRPVVELPLAGGPVPSAAFVTGSGPLPASMTAAAFGSGVLVAGLADARAFDAGYRGLVDEVAAQIGHNLASARVREQQRRQARAIEDLDAAKTAFFSNASHELRTPLSLVLGSLEQASEDSRQTARMRDRLDVARRNAVRMLKLVNALLDFSSLEAGVHRGVFTATELGQFTASLVAMFGSAAELAGLELENACRPLGEPIYVDRQAWEKVVGNLLSNSLKFTPVGRISVTVELDPRHARLTVRDSGIGIAPEHLEQVFSRFHRLSDPRARSRDGTGIGLALVRELVGLHGGTVQARSRVDEGTEMVVRIPRGRDHLPADRCADEPPAGHAVSAAALFAEDAAGWVATSSIVEEGDRWLTKVAASEAPARVLVVDDDHDMRRYVSELLAPCFAVDTAPDGQAALESAVADPPDVIVSDVMMPGLDGLGLVRALRAHERTLDVPIVLLSARADASSLEALRLGADDYLLKPIGARELVARVRATVQLSRLRREAAEARGRLEERSRTERELRRMLADLRAAQRRVVTAGDVERRRIERNLHDGAQQRLLAIQLELDAASARLDADPAAARRSLERVNAELGRSLEELRKLAHGLFPPVLTSDGLPAALRETARHAGVPVSVRAAGVGRLAPELETAAYFCCVEALQNAAKHGGAGVRVTIIVEHRDGGLEFSVHDDGGGFDPASVMEGYGLANLRDRLAALGGEAEIRSRPGGGTVVRGRLPLATTRSGD